MNLADNAKFDLYISLNKNALHKDTNKVVKELCEKLDI